MEFEQFAGAVVSLTGRPDAPIDIHVQTVCEEIRLSGLYIEDYRITVIHDGDWEFDTGWDSDGGGFYLENPDWNQGDMERSGTPVISSMVAFLGGPIGEPVVIREVTTSDVRQYRGCKYPNYFRRVRPMEFEGHAQANPFEFGLELAYYDRSPLTFGDNNKAYETPWPLDSCPHVVMMGVASKVMLAVGDDPSRDRMYTEYMRLLRQFQLSRIETPPT